MSNKDELAINGGPKVRTESMPGRKLLWKEEKEAVNKLFDKAIETGNAFGYNGPEEEAYCEDVAEFYGGGYVDAVNSGTSAVFVALRALNPEPFTEVIVPPITDPGGFMPVVMCNCIPVVADAAPFSYNTGPEQVEKEISSLTSAIIVSHIGGEPADIEGIMEVARKHDIPVIEDVAQAHGTRINGKLVGTFGDIASFSTMFGKHYCTGGQGGFVYTKDEDLYWKTRRVSDRGKPFGLPDGATNSIASLNFNLNDLQAVIGREQLKKLPDIVAERRAVVDKLKEGLEDIESIIVPEQIPGAEPSYWFFRLQVNTDVLTCDKETFCKAVQAEGIPLAARYEARPFKMDWYKNKHVFGESDYPWSSPDYKGDLDREFACPNIEETLSVQFNLSVHEGWREQEIEDALKAFAKVEKAYRA